MRFLSLALAGFSVLASSALAAPVTYIVTGNLGSNYFSNGPQAAALATAMGQPSTYEARFMFDTSDGQMGNLYFVGGVTASLRVDGNLLFETSGQIVNNTVAIGSSGGPTGSVLYLQAKSMPGDRFPAIPGSETISFEAKLYTDISRLSLTGPFPADSFTFVNSSSELIYSNFDFSNGPPQSSAVFRGTSGPASGAVTNFEVLPVPEPGEWAMIGAGLLIVGGAARRRTKARA